MASRGRDCNARPRPEPRPRSVISSPPVVRSLAALPVCRALCALGVCRASCALGVCRALSALGVCRALCALGLLGVLACTSSAPVRTVPVLLAEDTDPAAGYEAPPVESAAQILPPELLRGPHHEVADEVVSDGFRRHYWIASPYGETEAVGDAMLRRRVAELRALAVLEEMSGTREFAEAAARGLASPFVATWNLIRHPVDSITGIPTGAWDQIQRIASLTGSERSELEDGSFRAFIGFEKRKRELAARLGVDPYSSNAMLQRELNRMAWVSFAGGLPFALVPFTGAGEAGAPSLAVVASSDRLDDLLLHYSPEDLARFNRIELAVMGVPERVRDAFLAHPWYSPRHETVLVASLTALDPAPGRPDVVEAALSAASESDAFHWQRTAELLRAYHDAVAPMDRVVVLEGGGPAGHSAEGTLVVPLAADRVYWTRPAEEIARAAERALAATPEVATAELVVSGTLSPRARAGFEAHGLAVTERAFERLRVEGGGVAAREGR